MAALGFGLIALILSGDGGTVLGIENHDFARIVALSCWGILIAAGLLGGQTNLGEAARNAAIWIGIVLILMAGYVFRFDLQDVGSRFTGGLIPGSPISSTATDGANRVTLIRAPNGHFEARADIDGATVRFLVDTGASDVVLSARDARKIGIELDRLNYSIPVSTANGVTRVARTTVDRLSIGSISRSRVGVSVAQPGDLGQSLLGQTFLESLSAYEKRGDRLTLID